MGATVWLIPPLHAPGTKNRRRGIPDGTYFVLVTNGLKKHCFRVEILPKEPVLEIVRRSQELFTPCHDKVKPERAQCLQVHGAQTQRSPAKSEADQSKEVGTLLCRMKQSLLSLPWS
jgi:hypothetical protein